MKRISKVTPGGTSSTYIKCIRVTMKQMRADCLDELLIQALQIFRSSKKEPTLI